MSFSLSRGTLLRRSNENAVSVAKIGPRRYPDRCGGTKKPGSQACGKEGKQLGMAGRRQRELVQRQLHICGGSVPISHGGMTEVKHPAGLIIILILLNPNLLDRPAVAGEII